MQEQMGNETNDQSINIYFSIKKLPILLAGCWLFVAIGVLSVIFDQSLNVVSAVLLLLCALFFAIVSLCCLYCFLARIPMLVVDDDGIRVAKILGAFYGASLTWEEITFITASKQRGVTNFLVGAYIPSEYWSAFISRQSPLFRWLFLPFVGFGPGKLRAIIRISNLVLPCSADQLVKQIQNQGRLLEK